MGARTNAHPIRRRRAARARIVLVTAATLIGLVAGCTRPRATPAPRTTAAPVLNDGSATPPPMDGATAAAQAERDVAALQKLRRDAEELGGPFPGGATETAAATEAEPDPAPPRIVWNQPRTAPRRPAANTPSPVLARAEPAAPPVRAPKAAPAETIEVRPAPPAGDALANLDREDLDLLLVELRRALFRRSIDSDQPIRELLALAMLSIVDPDLELRPEAFRDLTDEERAALARFQQFFAGLGRRLDGSTDAIEEINQAVASLGADLMPDPVLELPTTTLCWRVGGFGDYDRFDRLTFLAHAEQQVILYIEIEDFASRQNEKGQWLTEVSQQLEIYSDADGIPVWGEPWQKAVDVSAKPRRDFFTTQLITLPKALSVGRYHLKIRVRDEQSGAEAEQRVSFDMTADPKRAARVPG